MLLIVVILMACRNGGGSGNDSKPDPDDAVLELAISFPAVGDVEQRDFSAEKLADLSVRRVRLSASWDRIEPEPGEFDWGVEDNHMIWAHENDLEILLTVTARAPDWACPPDTRGERGGCVPEDIADFERFVGILADRLVGFDETLERGLPVARVQFGNEWDEADVGFYPGSAEEYTTQLNIVHDEITSAFPDMPIVVGGLLGGSMRSIAICEAGSDHFGEYDPADRDAFCTSTLYLEKRDRVNHVFSFGRYSMVDQHLYFDPENWKVYVDTLRDHGLPSDRRSLPILVSEFGGPNAKIESRDDDYHADRVEDYLEALITTDVSEAYFFKLIEGSEWNEKDQQSSYADSGLIEKDTREPKPAYEVFKDYARRLNLAH